MKETLQKRNCRVSFFVRPGRKDSIFEIQDREDFYGTVIYL